MGFDFISQLRGPEIDESLMLKAMDTGATVANKIKTPLQATMEGLTEGIKTYADVQQSFAQTEQAKVITEAARMKLEEEQILQADKLAKEHAELQYKKAENERKLQEEQAKAAFRKQYDALQGNPQAQADLLLKNAPIFAGDSKTFDMYGKALDLAEGFTPEQSERFKYYSGRNSVADMYERRYLDALNSKLNKAHSAVYNSSEFKTIKGAFRGKYPDEDILDNVIWEPSGRFTKDKDGKWMEDPSITDRSKQDAFERLPDGRRGPMLAYGVPYKFNDDIEEMKGIELDASGYSKRMGLQKYDREYMAKLVKDRTAKANAATQQQQQPQPEKPKSLTEGFGKKAVEQAQREGTVTSNGLPKMYENMMDRRPKTRKINPAKVAEAETIPIRDNLGIPRVRGNAKLQNILLESLGVSGEDAAPIKDLVDDMLSNLAVPEDSRPGQFSAEQIEAAEQAATEIATIIANQEWAAKENALARTAYTPRDVRLHNNRVDTHESRKINPLYSLMAPTSYRVDSVDVSNDYAQGTNIEFVQGEGNGTRPLIKVADAKELYILDTVTTLKKRVLDKFILNVARNVRGAEKSKSSRPGSLNKIIND